MKVRCSRKRDGCEWEGELRHLEKHEREECGWALVQCRYHCGGRVFRRQLAEHEIDECQQRPVDVKFESFMRKMEAKLTSEKERHERELAAVREVMEQQKIENETTIEQLEQSLKEMRGELHKW